MLRASREQVCKRTRNPAWNQSFRFKGFKDAAELTVDVWDFVDPRFDPEHIGGRFHDSRLVA